MFLVAWTAIEVLNLIAGAEERQQELRAKYVYREVQENWRLDPYGRKIDSSHRTKTFDVILVQGQRYRKLIERNGVPLTASEQWEVEQDIARLVPTSTPTTSLRDLSAISITDSTLDAKADAKSYSITFDPATYAVLRQVTVSGSTRMTVESARFADGVYLPVRVEVDFEVSDIHGFQISTFSMHRKIE